LKQELQRLTIPNTKVRRLGYFALFSKMIENTPLTRSSVLKLIIEEESKNDLFLKEACKQSPVSPKNITGEICSKGKSKGEDAFERYLGTATELGLILEMSGRLYNTKRGEVLSALGRNVQNPFILSLAQKYWFLRLILEKDYDYFRNVLFCSIKPDSNEELTFIHMVQELWRSKLAQGNFKSPEAYDAIKEAIEAKWTSRRYYPENIKAPRLEWFADLGLIDSWNKGLNKVVARESLKVLLDSGDRCFSTLFVLHMKQFVKGSITYWRELPSKNRDEWLKRFVTESFNLFTTEALPRISVNQIIEYGLSILAESGIICENDEFESALEKFIEGKIENYRYAQNIQDHSAGASYSVR
jgi:hypothetical protein